tara:strand:- start:9244 stop:9831 length:588 start_codon:yes stop_codon:yes gene_type:complete
MACDITKARPLDCKDQIGGIKMVYFTPWKDTYYGDIEFDATDTELIDGLQQTAEDITLFGYGVRQNTGSFTSTITAAPENGTTYFESVLNLSLNKLSIQDQKELRILTYGRVLAFVLDNNDNLFSIGWEFGCDVTGGTMVSGTAKGDMSGYTIDIRAQDKNMPYFLTPSTDSEADNYPFDSMSDQANITVTLTNS